MTNKLRYRKSLALLMLQRRNPSLYPSMTQQAGDAVVSPQFGRRGGWNVQPDLGVLLVVPHAYWSLARGSPPACPTWAIHEMPTVAGPKRLWLLRWGREVQAAD